MTAKEIYLDNSATTRVFPEVAELVSRIFLEEYGNPSSMHHKGVEAERELRRAKELLSGILKCQPKNLIFTSCGTESDNLAIIGCARANCRRGRHLITTKVEHPAVLEAMRQLEGEGFEIRYLPVDRDGRVSPEQVTEVLREDTILVSVMHTNNEIGAVEPVAEIGAAIKAKNPDTLFHVDAVQAFGKAQIVPRKLHADLVAVSGHKIHAPKGVGLLYVGDGVKIQPLLHGGGQQGGLRSGTENVAGIAGMALAAKRLYEHLEEDRECLFAMKAHFLEKALAIPEVSVNGRAGKDSAPQVISLSVPGVRAEVLLHALEDRGIYVSSGSACSSNRPHRSATLEAIGTPEERMDNTIRLSTSVLNRMEDMDAAAAALAELIPMLRRYTRG
ncbi:cysteine desulfurase family protein [Lachnoclostridium sp. Marseille-P6806]|uniref:cysteine desulfurase family protein n=1 Tax=Lachnoclostridium sp. Marseille-P6806 TaxID=2364793 RepID=UPI001030674D|nr:cysteine desulfurase family protein [Lachnoclostridium sp. Marseille-P6806]